jgi:F-box protein 9
VEEGGAILYLTDEFILHSIFPFLSTEYYAVCALVSSHWKSFTRSELAYKELCKRLYLNQSKRKALRVARFGGSYRTMLENRFRLKTGCGLYVLKCSKIKKIQRDMWTEIPAGVVLETTYYRYLYFFENGKVLYSLTSRPPHEQIPIFRRVLVTNQTQQSTIFGTYQIQKDECVVSIEHPWHHVRLFLRVMENGCPGSVGKFWSLQFEKHQSSASNDFDEYWSRDLVEYDVPIEPFRFLRNWRL